MTCLRVLLWLSAAYNFHISAKHIRGFSNTVADGISRLHEPNKIFWSACLVGLFSFFRKFNLVVSSMTQFDPKRHSKDVHFSPSGAVLLVQWSKTIQFHQKLLQIPLPHITDSPFCPSSALLLCIHLVPPSRHPLFLFCYASGSTVKHVTHSDFVAYLHLCLTKLGMNPTLYSGHSFRRGSASFAMQCEVPVELIELQGDWTSNAYERYLYPSLELRRKLASTLGKAFSRLTTTHQR